MAREEFIDNLRRASRLLAPPTVNGDQGGRTDAKIGALLHSADLWLTLKAVEGFSVDDFADWPEEEQQTLAAAVAAFRAIAEQVPANSPATKAQSRQARSQLEKAVQVLRDRLLPAWLHAQEEMMAEATAAAEAKGWFVERDDKEVHESLLGGYKAPRLRVRTPDNEVVLDPIACFGSGRQGIVDLVVLPTYETAFLVAYRDGRWQIVSRGKTANRRNFSQATFVNSINKLPHR